MFHIYFGEIIPSITDWIQAIGAIAVAAAFFLQYNVNKMQATQLRLSSLPIIKLEYLEDEPCFDPHIKSAGILIITIKKNTVYNLQSAFIDRDDIKFDLHGISNMSEGDTVKKRFSYLTESGLLYFIVQLTYSDILGNTYTQNFKYWENEFLPNAPKHLK